MVTHNILIDKQKHDFILSKVNKIEKKNASSSEDNNFSEYEDDDPEELTDKLSFKHFA